MKKKLKLKLSATGASINLTTDIWTSLFTHIQFLKLTAQLWTDHFKENDYGISTRKLEGGHFGEKFVQKSVKFR